MADYRRSGKIYIAYQGMDVKTIEIERELRKRVANEDAIKIIKDEDNNVIFAKVVNENYMQDRDPYQNGGIMTVNGYIQEELERVHNTETDPDRKHQITNYYYRNNGESLFKKMREENVHFSCVIYDSIINQLIAGVTEPTDKYTYLYYGYTKQNHEIMFSNVKEVLIPFCDEIKKMNNCTYMKNGEILTLDGKKEEVQLIEKNKHNGDFLIEGLNSLLVQITNDSVRKRIVFKRQIFLLNNQKVP